MLVQQVPSCKGLLAILALMGKWSRKMDIFNMHPQVASGRTSFATHGTTMSKWTSFGVGDYILIELSVRTTCKDTIGSITCCKHQESFCLSTHAWYGCSTWFWYQRPPGSFCRDNWMCQENACSLHASLNCLCHCQVCHIQCICELLGRPQDAWQCIHTAACPLLKGGKIKSKIGTI